MQKQKTFRAAHKILFVATFGLALDLAALTLVHMCVLYNVWAILLTDIWHILRTSISRVLVGIHSNTKCTSKKINAVNHLVKHLILFT